MFRKSCIYLFFGACSPGLIRFAFKHLQCHETDVTCTNITHFFLQGIKKVNYKKKFQSSACCWASTMYTPDANLVLMFTDGKIQIRLGFFFLITFGIKFVILIYRKETRPFQNLKTVGATQL